MVDRFDAPIQIIILKRGGLIVGICLTDEITIGVVIKTGFIAQRVSGDGALIGGIVLVFGTVTLVAGVPM